MIKINDRASDPKNNFNILRMMAAVGVLISHAYPLSSGREDFFSYLKIDNTGDDLGRVAVFVFFGISGFFITRSFEMRPNIWSFTKSRLLRLYPALIVMSVIVLAAVWTLGTDASPSEFQSDIPGYFLSIHAFHRCVFNNRLFSLKKRTSFLIPKLRVFF